MDPHEDESDLSDPVYSDDERATHSDPAVRKRFAIRKSAGEVYEMMKGNLPGNPKGVRNFVVMRTKDVVKDEHVAEVSRLVWRKVKLARRVKSDMENTFEEEKRLRRRERRREREEQHAREAKQRRSNNKESVNNETNGEKLELTTQDVDRILGMCLSFGIKTGSKISRVEFEGMLRHKCKLKEEQVVPLACTLWHEFCKKWSEFREEQRRLSVERNRVLWNTKERDSKDQNLEQTDDIDVVGSYRNLEREFMKQEDEYEKLEGEVKQLCEIVENNWQWSEIYLCLLEIRLRITLRSSDWNEFEILYEKFFSTCEKTGNPIFQSSLLEFTAVRIALLSLECDVKGVEFTQFTRQISTQARSTYSIRVAMKIFLAMRRCDYRVAAHLCDELPLSACRLRNEIAQMATQLSDSLVDQLDVVYTNDE